MMNVMTANETKLEHSLEEAEAKLAVATKRADDAEAEMQKADDEAAELEAIIKRLKSEVERRTKTEPTPVIKPEAAANGGPRPDEEADYGSPQFWLAAAHKLWPKAMWIDSRGIDPGPWVVESLCRGNPTVTLFPSRHAAEKAREKIDENGCNTFKCMGRHNIVSLVQAWKENKI